MGLLLPYRPESFTHFLCVENSHIITLIFGKTASKNCRGYFFPRMYSRQKEYLYYLLRLQIAPHLISVNMQAKYASMIYSFSTHIWVKLN